MSKFCPNCATALDTDARFCPSCRVQVGVAGALASELGGRFKSSVKGVMAEATGSVPPFVWAAAIQFYWLLFGSIWLISAISGLIAGSAALMSTFGRLLSSSAAMEHVVLVALFAALAGIVNTCLSLVLVYGFLNLKQWSAPVFMVWLPLVLGFLFLAVISIPSSPSGGADPFIVDFVGAVFALLNIGALVLQFFLVRRGKAATQAAAAAA